MRLPFILVLTLCALPAMAQTPEPPPDYRQWVEMPELQRELLREEMQEHLIAYQRILDHLARGEISEAGEMAEQTMGVSTMGKHRSATRGLGGPGRYMPDGMRQMAFAMHESATEFAEVAQEEDMPKALRALHELTSTCVGCHMSFRTR
ncbi:MULTISPECIES: cytochrome c [unclassified Ectothiorhodospira]|uniref:cytochrome c n=1 Tax=unclassified Ectothiorhodospira TaxID=2684909 RepID=UPI001EE90EAB|nr:MULTISPECIES: cytochrome c [unclassified Ectothiorhodospira]MCG5516892.1 cytochrome c [Ectothiorhodospira sp. 9100]MCG5519854.1 cytochrome c [Ectothiorhodospira sp. 9905]